LIEQSVYGPNSTQGVMDTAADIGTDARVEWFEPYLQTISPWPGLGVFMFIETAENGGKTLDDPFTARATAGTGPSCRKTDQGPFRGGGRVAQWQFHGKARACFTPITVRAWICQGWGEKHCHHWLRDLYDAEGPNLFYPPLSPGTSGATPISWEARLPCCIVDL